MFTVGDCEDTIMIEIETFTLNILFSACKIKKNKKNKTQIDLIFLILCTRVFDIVSIIYCKEKFFHDRSWEWKG